MSGNENESNSSKYQNLHQPPSTSQIRNKIKKMFVSNLKDARRKSIDAKRFGSSNSNQTRIIHIMQNLRETLNDSKDLKGLISPEEIDDIISEVRREIQCVEELDIQSAEMQAIIENLMTCCEICDQLSETEICQTCSNKYFTDSNTPSN